MATTKAPKVEFDLDAELGFDEPSEDLEVKTVKLFGEPTRLLTGLNSYNLSALTSGDADAIARFIDNVVHPDDRADFRRRASTASNLTPTKLAELINKIIEVIAERPTTRPSASRAGASKRTSSPRSAAST